MALKKPATRWIIAAGVLLFFIVVLILLDRALELDPLSQWALRIGFVLLGLIAAGAIVWFLRPRAVEPVDTGDDVLLAIGSARGRLPRGSFSGRAMVLVLGSEGSTKTTLVARSGGDPELLAGLAPASAAEAPVPTKTVNLWLMQQAVITELGGALLTDAPRWATVIRALRAPRVAAAVSKGDTAARSAVVCVPCDLFYAGGSGQELEQLGHLLRQRLAEASRELGLAMPVYVVFTKMDRLPHFEPWIGLFTRDELRAPLGATLPFDRASTTANYAERLTARLDAAFRDIVDIVQARRVDILGRDSVAEHRYGAYELPRELQKLGPSVTSFLVELCRPTQLGSSPQLRGFYFMGARPVVVNDVAKAPTAKAASTPLASHATQAFRLGATAAPEAPAAAPAVARRVPEWVFLDRFLRDVVLADTGAASVARGGVEVKRTRRVLLGAAGVASLLLLVLVTASWLGNRALTQRVDTAARGVAALPVVQSAPGTIAFPSLDALRRLELLRGQLDTLRGYVADGPPLWMRFGLWNGPALFDAARGVWYEGFRAQLFAAGWGAVVDSLKALPETPTAANDYGTSYGWLKAYLITTTAPERSTSEFLAPVLLKSWQRGQATDADVTGLAGKQFAFYASELPRYNPWPRAADAGLVASSRKFLQGFTGGEQIYTNMLVAANKAAPPVKLPQAPGILTVTPEVPGAFSAKGAALMADAFRNSDRYFQGETWVVGDATAARASDRDAVIAVLRTKYHDDYARAWTQVLQTAKVVPPTNLKDAATKLEVLDGTMSPLLAVLRTVAVNTNGDSLMRAAFQPVHAVTPPEIVDKFISEKNQPYMDGLVELQGALVQVDNMPKGTDTATVVALVQAARSASPSVMKARAAEKKVASAFLTTAAASAVAAPVDRLLIAPISGAEAVLNAAANSKPLVAVAKPAPKPAAAAGAPAPAAPAAEVADPAIADLKAAGIALCRSMNPVLAKFPFKADAAEDATLAEVTALLAPETGSLWEFRLGAREPFLTKAGDKWVAKPVKNITLSPEFVTFFNHAAQVSFALFGDTKTKPEVTWKVQAEVSPQTPLITLQHGDNRSDFNGATPRNIVNWPKTAASKAALAAQFGKEKVVPVLTTAGEWALFRLVAKGAPTDAPGRSLRVTWTAPQAKNAAPVVLVFGPDEGSNPALLKPGWMGDMRCVPPLSP